MDNGEWLEARFQSFLRTQDRPFNRKSMDFLGINISNQPGKELVFKIYYSDHYSEGEDHPLIKYLSEKQMLLYYAMVKDTQKPECSRMDLALKNRTDTNMKQVFQTLDSMTDLFQEGKDEILKLSRMRITEKEKYNLASLYHLGFIRREEEIELLKCHFFMRYCKNPEFPNRDFVYEDSYYLEYLENCGIWQYEALAKKARLYLDAGQDHLWMAGLDMGKSGYKKYKLYVRNTADIYPRLKKCVSEPIGQKLSFAADWEQLHQEFSCEGAALSLDTDSVESVNLYYAFKREH